MRSRKLLLVLGVIVLTGLLVAFVGCGSDDKSTGDVGDINDPEFQVVRDEIGHFVDSTLEFFTNGLGNIYGLATDTVVDPPLYGPGPPDFDSTKDTATATYANGWHVVYFAIHRDAYDAILLDSIQFIKDGEAQQTSTGVESLLYKHFWQYGETDTTVTFRSCIGDADYSFTGLNTTTATINGTNDLQAHSKYVSTDSTVWRDINIEATLTGMQVNKTAVGWAQNCPSSGSVSGSIEMVYQKDSDDPITSNWTVNVTFDDGSMSVIVSRGSTTWMYNTQLCTPPN